MKFRNYFFTFILFTATLWMALPTPVLAQLVNPVKDSLIQFTDITTNNASATKHGFLPKLDNTGSKFLRDDGTWQTPAAGGWSVLGALDGVSDTALGASATSTTLYMQSASASAPGLVNTTTQTFAGTKTFSLISASTVSDTTITVKDDAFTLQDNSDPTKRLVYQLSGIAANTTRTWSFNNVSDVFVGEAGTQTLTNKTVSGTTANSINTFDGASFSIVHSGGKRIRFNADIMASGTTRTVSVADADIQIGKVPTVQTFTTGTNTYTTPSGVRYIEILLVGGGGGGQGSGTASGTTATDGTSSVFSGNGISFTAGAGSKGDYINFRGGAGGTNTVSGGTTVLNVQGTRGGAAGRNLANEYMVGGDGGSSCLGGGGAGGGAGDTGQPASANTGSGGGGGGTGTTASTESGPAGGSGGCLRVLLTAPGVSYSVVIGNAGLAGGAGASGFAGASGASGTAIVTEYYH